MLIDTCPACSIALRRGTTTKPAVLLRRHPKGLDAKECGNRTFHPQRPREAQVCRQRLTDIPTQPAPEALAAFQQRVLAIADGQAARVAGKPVSGADWFATVRFVAAAARLVIHDDELGDLPDALAHALAAARETRHESRTKHSSGGVSAPGAKPESAAAAAAILALAAPVVDAPAPDAGGHYLAAWTRRLAEERKTRHHGMDPLRKIHRPPIVDEMSVTDQKATAAIPRPYPLARAKPAKATAALEIRHIPHRIGTDDYHDLMAAHLPTTLPSLGRHFAALAFVHSPVVDSVQPATGTAPYSEGARTT
ncbi:hypothetical protein ADK86_26280 [Streptomyces sp. NRRL F-5755]|uniref:hypothetical protein n=1 Tax=Streptomyces sp. NRRL F-5755 TaxID=1519475 RepID=UPI0006AE3DD8|nr:hypothetical protein [Streptomyces sp. NRRL F-5755]KOT90408.1 hypothetical protein ADK86_26280 [Streptomyces sp. NRRL F-5755]